MNNAAKQKTEEKPVSFALKEKYQKLLENSMKAEQQKKVLQKDGLKHRKMSYLTTIQRRETKSIEKNKDLKRN